MTPFRNALTALAALNVAGVTNYDIDAVPETLNRGQLPALLVLPGTADDNRLFKDFGEGFRAVAFSYGARTLSVAVTHLLLLAPVNANTGIRANMPALVDTVDAYIAALAADVTLGGALLEPAQVTLEVGTFPYGGITYHGCAFRHVWALEVTQ
ncbi:MAG: hypothetical protein AAFV33_01645 [Chloroflexota bacterium]